MDDKYKDMLELPYPRESRHPRMSRHNRAAQFSPFAALTGYEEAVEETARWTAQEAELDEGVIEQLDLQLQEISRQLQQGQAPRVSVTYFVPDLKKEGGCYVTGTGVVQKLDRRKGALVLEGAGEFLFVHIKELSVVH